MTAEDRYGNAVPNYAGTVHFSASDSAAVLPPSSTLSSSGGIFSVTLKSEGNQTVTAADTRQQQPERQHHDLRRRRRCHPLWLQRRRQRHRRQFPHLHGDGPGPIQRRRHGLHRHRPLLQQRHAGWPAGQYDLDQRQRRVRGQPEDGGQPDHLATDTLTSSITGASSTIVVSPGAATHFGVAAVGLPTYAGIAAAYPGLPSVPSSFATAGMPFSFNVVAEDQFNNTAPTYAGTVQFTSSDTRRRPAGQQHLERRRRHVQCHPGHTGHAKRSTATDVANPSLTGTSSAVIVRGPVVTSFSPTPSGFTITFNEPFVASAVNMYTTGSLPDDVILATTNSQVSVRGSLVINPGGTSFTFVKTATVSALGAFNPNSGLLAAGTYTVTLRSYSAGSSGFKDALGNPLDGTNSGGSANYQITFAVTAPPVAVGIPDFARGPSNTDAIFLPTTLTNGSTFALSYTNPLTSPTTGTATVTFSTTAATLQSNIQNALSTGGLATQIGVVGPGGTPNAVVVVTNDTSTGANVLVTFQSALAQATSQLLTSTTPGVTIGLAPINAANNIPGSGIPIALSSGQGVTSGSFTLQYNPSLLNITGVVSKIPGASFTFIEHDSTTPPQPPLVLSLVQPVADQLDAPRRSRWAACWPRCPCRPRPTTAASSCCTSAANNSTAPAGRSR